MRGAGQSQQQQEDSQFVGKQRQSSSQSMSRLGKQQAASMGRSRNRPRARGDHETPSNRGGQSMLASHRRVERSDAPDGVLATTGNSTKRNKTPGKRGLKRGSEIKTL